VPIYSGRKKEKYAREIKGSSFFFICVRHCSPVSVADLPTMGAVGPAHACAAHEKQKKALPHV